MTSPAIDAGDFLLYPGHMKSKAKQAIENALEDRGLVAQPYSVPDTINGKPVRVVGVRENVIKIQMYDPIEFLGRVMAGEPIPTTYIDEEGQVSKSFEIASLKERVSIAKFMANKIMPSMHVIKDLRDGDDSPGKTGFDALVDEALKRGRQITNGAQTLGKKPS